uniref:Retrotransposon gag domain-containing protein n=1 Tax=Oncorhynchus kisutch TaxID=8019 RepID=A0A8C7CF31_ONCKI
MRSWWILVGTRTRCRTRRSRASKTFSMGESSGEYADHVRTGRFSHLRTAIDKVLQIVHQLQATQPPSHKVHLPLAEGFLLQCDLHLAHLAGTASVRDKVALLISVLTDRALEWAHAIWERDSPEVQSYECFTQLVHAVFEGSKTASEYALDFRKVAASTGWNDQVLLMVFRSGLQADVQTDSLIIMHSASPFTTPLSQSMPSTTIP